MKIIIDEDIPFIKQVFEQYADVIYMPGNKFSKDVVCNADALIVRTRTRCNRDLLEGSSVRFIASATIGYDHIDTDWCASKGIRWSNAAGCNAKAVGQYVVCAMLELAYRKGINLAGKTLGIVGVGHVGSNLLLLAEALQVNVLCCDPPRADLEGSGSFVDLHELAAQSDFVSFHVPLQQSGAHPTLHLASNRFFENLKQGAIFINSSRGEVTDPGALISAIVAGKLGAVALDVWEHEPKLDTGLLSMVDLGSPHIAGYSAQGKANATSVVVRQIAKALNLPLVNRQIQPEPPLHSLICIDGRGLGMQEIMRQAMSKTYSICSDDKNLRANPSAFEQLRKDYFHRHEACSYHLQVTGLPEGGARQLKQLGFLSVTSL